MRDYSEEFPRIDEYISEMAAIGKEFGCIYNNSGRRLSIEHGYYYRAVNYAIQSLAADIMKRAMRRLHKYFRMYNKDAHMIFTIHDEIIFEVHEKHLTGKWEERKNEKGRDYIWTNCALLRKIKRMMQNNGGWVDIETPVEFDLVRDNWDHKISLEVK